jgi:biopolymer transport protein ExbD
MKFYPRRRRTAPAVIIISLIDVLIVMLVFLMVTTTFRNVPAIKLTLPETSEGLKAGATTAKVPLVVTVSPNEPNYYIENRAVTGDKLLSELKSLADKDPATRLVIRADSEAAWRLVVKVLVFAKQAQLTNVQAFTRSAGQK